MILLVHMIFGAAVGYATYQFTDSLLITVIAALLCHYFLDLFPHIEYLESVDGSIEALRNPQAKTKGLSDAAKIFADFFLGLIIIFPFSQNHPVTYLGALVALIPDGLTVVTKLFPNRILLAHQYMHGDRVIHFLKNKKISVSWRIATQVIATIISIVLLSA